MEHDEDEESPAAESYKIILIGDSAVGKTSIINRFAENEYPETHIITIGTDLRVKNIYIDGTKIKVQLWDTAGQERFRSISRNFYRGADGIIVVYAINDTKSFQNVRTWFKDINTSDSADDGNGNTHVVVKYLVGNKADLGDSVRTVSEEAGNNLAETHDVKFMEVSAKSSMNIEKLFINLIKDIRANNARPESPKGERVEVGATEHKRCCK